VRTVLAGWRPLVWVFLALTLLSTASLYVAAESTDRLFAWTINPPLSAAFLGAGYASGFVLVVLTMRERLWARARLAYATVCLFVWVTLVATLLHLDRFHFDAADPWPRFFAWLWLVVYVVVPPWMTGLLFAQRRVPGNDPEVARPIPPGFAVVLALQAILLGGLGLALVIAPIRLAELWPWTLTPLTGRAIGAWLLALGFAAGLAAHERDLSRLRAAAVTYVCFGVLQAGALVRFSGDVDWDRATAWAYLAGLAAITISGGYGWLAGIERVGPDGPVVIPSAPHPSE
jgi:hypothetical protein